MRRVLGDILSRVGVDESSIADLLLAVTEACTNVLRHSGQGRGYEIVARVAGNRLPPRGRRQRPRFRPGHALPVPPPGRPPPGPPGGRAAPPARPLGAPGLAHLAHAAPPDRPAAAADPPPRASPSCPSPAAGLAIMRACVDDVTLSSGPGQGTVVSLQKRIAWRADAPLATVPQPRLRDAG